MPRSVSATEAKNKLGSLIGWVAETGDEVIVENHGEPAAVLISVTEYDELRTLREKERRARMLEEMRALRRKSLARNADLTPEEGEALAERFAREVIEDMVKEGKIRFED